KAVKSLSSKGTLLIVTPNGEFPVSFESVDVFPNQSYQVAEMMGTKMYDVWTGTAGWKTVAPGTIGDKSEDDLAADAKDRRRNTILLLANSDNPEFRPVYAGADKFNGQSAEIIAIVDEADNEICRLALDPTAHTLLGKSYWGQGMMGGEGTIV